MKLTSQGYYKADKGKHFVLTEKGKAECAGYQDKTIGEPIDKYDDCIAYEWNIRRDYLTEVDIPNWITKEGYEVVYDYNGYTLCAGNHIVFPERQIAERYKKNQEKEPWMKEHKLYIRPAIFEGVALRECRTHNNKQVYNADWYYGIDCLQLGNLVEEEIVSDIVDALPPACMKTDCTQLGEPADHRIDENGRTHAVFATFRRVAENTWEYCGKCFRGENVQRGIAPVYV